MEHYENFTENINPPHQHPLREKITGGTLEVRSDKSLTLLTFDRVSDVVENGGCFASKILTHNRMH